MDQALDRLEAQLAFNDSERETTAIIGNENLDCRALADQLNGRGVNHLIQSQNQRLAPGTIIVPSPRQRARVRCGGHLGSFKVIIMMMTNVS